MVWKTFRRPLRFESLEDRRVLAAFTVTNFSDTPISAPNTAPGTLRQAIYDANHTPGDDDIYFADGLSGTLNLTAIDDTSVGASALAITSKIAIHGNAAGITIKRDAAVSNMRLFYVAPSGDLTLDSLNVTGGVARGDNGAAGQNGVTGYGGAVYNQGSLTLTGSTLYSNSAIGGNAGAGGNGGGGLGGAIYCNAGTLSIRNSTLANNSVSSGAGGAAARSFGGAIYAFNGNVTIDNSTITNNSANSGRELYVIGSGIGQQATVQIFSSIIAQSDVQLLALDVNLTDDAGGSVNVTGSNNLIRSQNAYQSITISSDDPILGTLGNNGGPTLTFALPAESPAVDHGLNPLNLTSDQRGSPSLRTVGIATDIGAYEYQTAVGQPLPGDYNASHTVDSADYVIWRKTFGTSVTQYSGADGNGNASVDMGDLAVWRGNFGASLPGSGSAAGVSADSPTTQKNPQTKFPQPRLPQPNRIRITRQCAWMTPQRLTQQTPKPTRPLYYSPFNRSRIRNRSSKSRSTTNRTTYSA